MSTQAPPCYRYGAPRPAWALAAIAAAEAEHGAPEPTCACGAPLPDERARNARPCQACEPPAAPAGPPPPMHFLTLAEADEPACHTAGAYTAITDPRAVTCRVCLRTRALALELAARMVTA